MSLRGQAFPTKAREMKKPREEWGMGRGKGGATALATPLVASFAWFCRRFRPGFRLLLAFGKDWPQRIFR